MSLTQIKKVIQETSFFSESDWETLAPQFQKKKYEKGDLFLSAGQVSKKLGFISKGFFRKYYIRNGDDINFWFYKENQFLVAYRSFLDQSPTNFHIEALEDSEIIYLPYNAVQEMYAHSHDWQVFGRLICEKMYIAHHTRIENLLLKDATARYHDLVKDYPDIVNRVPQYHLASYLGIKPQSLSRIRSQM